MSSSIILNLFIFSNFCASKWCKCVNHSFGILFSIVHISFLTLNCTLPNHYKMYKYKIVVACVTVWARHNCNFPLQQNLSLSNMMMSLWRHSYCFGLCRCHNADVIMTSSLTQFLWNLYTINLTKFLTLPQSFIKIWHVHSNWGIYKP